jgi:aconitate hydratase
VIAESFERIHRSNLVGMGVLPLQFTGDHTRKTLGLTGHERFDIIGLTGAALTPHMSLTLRITRDGGERTEVQVLCRIDTLNEVEYFKAGGILHYVLRQLIG